MMDSSKRANNGCENSGAMPSETLNVSYTNEESATSAAVDTSSCTALMPYAQDFNAVQALISESARREIALREDIVKHPEIKEWVSGLKRYFKYAPSVFAIAFFALLFFACVCVDSAPDEMNVVIDTFKATQPEEYARFVSVCLTPVLMFALLIPAFGFSVAHSRRESPIRPLPTMIFAGITLLAARTAAVFGSFTLYAGATPELVQAYTSEIWLSILAVQAVLLALFELPRAICAAHYYIQASADIKRRENLNTELIWKGFLMSQRKALSARTHYFEMQRELSILTKAMEEQVRAHNEERDFYLRTHEASPEEAESFLETKRELETLLGINPAA